MYATANLVSELGLETICESGKCPNRAECWTRRTATFMLLGETCTRPCGFCAVPRGKPAPAGRRRAGTGRRGLRPARIYGMSCITSVTRDDLPDGGADHFRRMRPSRPPANRRDDRGSDPRLRGRRDRPRHRTGVEPRGLQPQPRNGRATPATRPPQEPVRRQSRRCSNTSSADAPTSAPRAA